MIKSGLKSYQSLPDRLNFVVELKYQSCTIIIFIGIKYSVHDLILNVSNYA